MVGGVCLAAADSLAGFHVDAWIGARLGILYLHAKTGRVRLIDEYQAVVIPLILGGGRTMFNGVTNIRYFSRVRLSALTAPGRFAGFTPGRLCSG